MLRWSRACSRQILLICLALLSACSPVEGQEQTLLGPGPPPSRCSADAPDEAAVADAEQLLPADAIASEGESGDVAVPSVPGRDPEWVGIGAPESGVRTVVVDKCSPAGGDFLSEEEPGILAQMQLLTGF